MRGPPFGPNERADIQHYNLDDTKGAARVFKKLVPTIPSLRYALHRGEFEWALSGQERRGIPTDLARRERIDEHWSDIKTALVRGVDSEFGCYDIVDGEPHFREEKFEKYCRDHRPRIHWPRLDSGKLRPESANLPRHGAVVQEDWRPA